MGEPARARALYRQGAFACHVRIETRLVECKPYFARTRLAVSHLAWSVRLGVRPVLGLPPPLPPPAIPSPRLLSDWRAMASSRIVPGPPTHVVSFPGPESMRHSSTYALAVTIRYILQRLPPWLYRCMPLLSAILTKLHIDVNISTAIHLSYILSVSGVNKLSVNSL